MSMKHEYNKGDVVWYKGIEVVFRRYDTTDSGRFFYDDGKKGSGYGITKHLSPYPPVKAVDGWAVVNRNSEIITIGITKPESNWMAANGYRCVKGQFIPNNDNS